MRSGTAAEFGRLGYRRFREVGIWILAALLPLLLSDGLHLGLELQLLGATIFVILVSLLGGVYDTYRVGGPLDADQRERIKLRRLHGLALLDPDDFDRPVRDVPSGRYGFELPSSINGLLDDVLGADHPEDRLKTVTVSPKGKKFALEVHKDRDGTAYVVGYVRPTVASEPPSRIDLYLQLPKGGRITRIPIASIKGVPPPRSAWVELEHGRVGDRLTIEVD